ncbi:dihydrodipicolinate synthase family protein [Paenibacillus thalictri]|uniref:N-acetylneuraminate lyase n=1 Tax=Paenibacillus thalictri TaxID=2527873 RepID=A0A4Q9DKE3_9BACL|nr:dihydrodipicolinate synthase family protein [Paenibacillus thalictri]TBL75243.1 N-acetylneuraminate lyase [Paenibacillus thalictri]
MYNTDLTKFTGVHVAMNSCYDPAGRINPDAVCQLTEYLIQRGVQGVYVGGSTGEGLLQTVAERKLVLEHVAAQSGGRFTIIAHIGAMNTEDSMELARHAESLGVDAISSVPPFYYGYSESAVKHYWTSIMDSCSLPFIIYHIPGATGFQLTTPFLKTMLEHPRLAGAKVTSFSSYELQQIKATGGENFVVFNGPDQQYLAGRSMGADGGIGSTYGMMPELFLKIEACYVRGNMAEAQRWQAKVNEIITDVRALGLFGSIKEMIKLRGVDCGEPRRPLEPVKSGQYAELQRVYEKMMGFIEEAQPE